MNPDTAPIAEVEAWLVGKQYPLPACLTERIGHTIDAALTFMPAGWDWTCGPHAWYAMRIADSQEVEVERVNSPRDELLRLAAKAWMKMEEAR